MDNELCELQVFFDGQFWVGLFQVEHNGQLKAHRIIFGAEPKDYEVYQYILQNYYKLKFSPPVDTDKRTAKRVNPKRMQREIKKKYAEFRYWH